MSHLLEFLHRGDPDQLPDPPPHNLAHIGLGSVLPGHQGGELLSQFRHPLSTEHSVLQLAADTAGQAKHLLSQAQPNLVPVWLVILKPTTSL